MEVLEEYKNPIYPFKLWVGCGVSYEQVNGTFLVDDVNKLTSFENYEDYFEGKFDACVFKVVKKDTDEVGALLYIPNIEKFTLPIMVHEIVHITNYVFDLIGNDLPAFSFDEPTAYLAEWITKQICDALNITGYAQTMPKW